MGTVESAQINKHHKDEDNLYTNIRKKFKNEP